MADEIGRTTPRATEHFGGLVLAKKQLVISDTAVQAAALSALLLCDAPGTVITVLVNGHPLQCRWPRKPEYWHHHWKTIPVPVRLLKKGLNEFVFRTEQEGSCALLVEDSLHPRRSAKSIDGGRSWSSTELGTNGAFRHGEYVVRLELKRFAPQGTITSPPVDLARLAGAGAIAPKARLLRLSFATQQRWPAGTRISLAARFGPSPSYEPASWTCWRPVTKEIRRLPVKARYVQWQATLQTARAAAAPTLRAVKLAAEIEAASPAEPIPVVQSDNPPIVRPSYHFAHQRFEEQRLAKFRRKWRLDSIISSGGTDFDQLVSIRKWVRRQWEDGWNRGPVHFVPPWDGFLILELASRQLSLGMCTHYATAFVHVCAALGFTARTQIMRGHCIAEVWSNHWRKWVAFDVGGDTNDKTKITYHIERAGVPQSALEVHRAWVGGNLKGFKLSPPSAAKAMKVGERMKMFERFCIHRRNDEMSSLEPGELEHGATSYHYDEYLWWQDGRTPPLPWFSRHSSREGDYHWTLNHAEIHLQRTEQPRVLNVQLDTVTPNFETFLCRIDKAQWQPCPACFAWPLKDGVNRLEARPRNKFGREGIVTSVVVST